MSDIGQGAEECTTCGATVLLPGVISPTLILVHLLPGVLLPLTPVLVPRIPGTLDVVLILWVVGSLLAIIVSLVEVALCPVVGEWITPALHSELFLPVRLARDIPVLVLEVVSVLGTLVALCRVGYGPPRGTWHLLLAHRPALRPAQVSVELSPIHIEVHVMAHLPHGCIVALLWPHMGTLVRDKSWSSQCGVMLVRRTRGVAIRGHGHREARPRRRRRREYARWLRHRSLSCG